MATKYGPPLRWMAACAVVVAGFEGVSTTAYHDKLANGLPTVCAGETEGVKMGDHYTRQQCLDMLANKLPRYWYEMEPLIHVPLSDNEKIAYTSFDYNLGTAVFARSAFLKKLNAGDHKGACEGMLIYNRTRSVGYVAGLDKRRHKEVSICLTIDKPGPVVRIVPLAPKRAPLQDEAPVVTHVAPAPKQKPLECHTFLIWRTCR